MQCACLSHQMRHRSMYDCSKLMYCDRIASELNPQVEDIAKYGLLRYNLGVAMGIAYTQNPLGITQQYYTLSCLRTGVVQKHCLQLLQPETHRYDWFVAQHAV